MQLTSKSLAFLVAEHNSTLHIFNVERIVGWGCILNCFMLSSLPCFLAFCWSAITTSCYIFNVFFFLILSMSLFLATGACLSWSLPSITEQQVCLALFLGLLHLQFLIARSLQKWRKKTWGISSQDLQHSWRHGFLTKQLIHIHIHSCREARESKQVPGER